jgi:hypothetical protein
LRKPREAEGSSGNLGQLREKDLQKIKQESVAMTTFSLLRQNSKDLHPLEKQKASNW